LSVEVVAGAAADDGLSFADVTVEAKHLSDLVGSIGVALCMHMAWTTNI
jgi:dihydroxyacetone kinase